MGPRWKVGEGIRRRLAAVGDVAEVLRRPLRRREPAARLLERDRLLAHIACARGRVDGVNGRGDEDAAPSRSSP